MKPISKDRALEQVEAVLHAALRRDYQAIRFMQMRELREILGRVGEVRVDLRSITELEEEIERLKRNLGQLGNSDPD